MSPYRHPAPRLPDPRPKRSTLRRLARVGDRSCRLYLPFRFRWRRVPRKVGAVALCSALYFPPAALLQAWPAWTMWPLLFAIGLATWAAVDVAMGYLRVLAVRRAAYCPACDGPCRDRLTARSPGTCLTCGGASGEPCDPYTHEFAATGTAAGRDAAEARRDNRIATRDAQATGVVTTFPRIAAYREAARTGDWLTFSARDLRPVTRLARDVDGAEARRGRTR